jgi:hypothetical protein
MKKANKYIANRCGLRRFRAAKDQAEGYAQEIDRDKGSCAKGRAPRQ